MAHALALFAAALTRAIAVGSVPVATRGGRGTGVGVGVGAAGGGDAEGRGAGGVGEVGGDLGGGAGVGRPVGVDGGGLPGGGGGAVVVVADGDDGGVGDGVASAVAAVGGWEVLDLVLGGAGEELVGIHRDEYHAFLNWRCVTSWWGFYDNLFEAEGSIALVLEHEITAVAFGRVHGVVCF